MKKLLFILILECFWTSYASCPIPDPQSTKHAIILGIKSFATSLNSFIKEYIDKYEDSDELNTYLREINVNSKKMLKCVGKSKVKSNKKAYNFNHIK